MTRFLRVIPYALTAAISAWLALAIYRGTHDTKPLTVGCTQVIVSEFGDPRLYRDKVCSDEDLARIYGTQELREQEWRDEHDCDVDDTDAPVVKRMKGRQ